MKTLKTLKTLITNSILLIVSFSMASPAVAIDRHASLYKTTAAITIEPDNVDKVILFNNISPQIIPSSISLNIDYTNLSINNNKYTHLNNLNRHIGKIIKIKPEEGSIFSAKLLATSPDVLVLTKSGFIKKITDEHSINFPSYQPTPSSSPSILVNTDNITTDPGLIRLSYLTNGVSWSPNHIISLSKNSLSFETQALISNRTNKDYNNISVSLMAGDIMELPQRANPRYASINLSKSAFSNNNLPQGVSGFYRYNIPETISIGSFETNYIPIIKHFSIPYKILNTLNFNPGSSVKSLKAMQVLKVKRRDMVFNDVIPAGKLMIYNVSNGISSFIGTKNIQDISRNENLSINFGRSSNVYANISTSNRTRTNLNKQITDKYTQHLIIHNQDVSKQSIKVTFSTPWQSLANSEKSKKPQSFRYIYNKKLKHAKITYKNKKGTFVIKLDPGSSIEGSINFSITR